MVTLSLVLGGTAVAASTATHKDKKADIKLIKKLAPTLSVKHANTANNATHATSADSATNATNATNAANATSATSATNATNATHATNADQLGGVPASSYEQFGSTLPPGQTETGVVGVAGGSSTSGYAEASFRFYPMLAAPLDGSQVEFTTGTDSNCPGVGQAAPGFLCIYGESDNNVTIDSIGNGAGTTGASPSGFLVFFAITGAGSYVQGHWAVTAPISSLHRRSAKAKSSPTPVPR
jgi:hypothetical protein